MQFERCDTWKGKGGSGKIHGIIREAGIRYVEEYGNMEQER